MFGRSNAMRAIDQYFNEQKESNRAVLLALRSFILGFDPHITEAWKYKMPFYCYKGRMCCYLWVHKAYKQPYLGIVDGKLINDAGLQTEHRKRMKILLLDPAIDLPIAHLSKLMETIIALCDAPHPQGSAIIL